MSLSSSPSHSCRVVTFGDSTTAPRENVDIYSDQLARKFPGVEFINRGVRGNNTDMAAARFESDVVGSAPKIVVIQFGINDAAVDVWKTPPATQPRVSLEKYRFNLQGFIKRCKETGSAPVLMTPNPLRWIERTLENYGRAPYEPTEVKGFTKIQSKYAQCVREVAAEAQLPLADVEAAYDEYEAAGNDVPNLLLDGMHPNSDGHTLVANLLVPILKDFIANPSDRRSL